MMPNDLSNGFKETELGPLPEAWAVVRLGEVCQKPQYGYTASTIEQPVGPKLLRITDIGEQGVNWSTVPYCECPKDVIEKYGLQRGDLLIARIGAMAGQTYLIIECPQAVFASYLIRVKTKSDLFPGYLSYFMQTYIYWRQIAVNKGGRLKQGGSCVTRVR